MGRLYDFIKDDMDMMLFFFFGRFFYRSFFHVVVVIVVFDDEAKGIRKAFKVYIRY